MLPPLLCGAAQFVEISAGIELTTYRVGETNDAASADRTRTISLVCITGTNEWRIEHDYIRNGENKWNSLFVPGMQQSILDWRFREPAASVNAITYNFTNKFAAPTNDPALQEKFRKRVERASELP